MKAYATVPVPEQLEPVELDPAHPTDARKLRLVDAILDAPETEGHRHVGQAFAEVERIARNAPLEQRPETRAAWDELVEASAKRCAFGDKADAVREVWRRRAGRVRRWGYRRGLLLVGQLRGGWQP